MNGRVATLLIGGVLCLAGIPALESITTPAVGLAVAAPAPPPQRIAAAPAPESRALIMDVASVSPSGIAPDVLQLAVAAVTCAVTAGDIQKPRTLTIIDYSLPSTDERLWVFDVGTGALLFEELVAHGRNTGENMATHFSDTPESRQSSIGLFVARDTYVGSNGYSLRLDGLEPGFNARARERAIVMHGAPYVDASLARTQGRIGRSWGCPALREAVARDVIDTVRGGGVIFSYYPDTTWLKASRFLNCAQPPVLLATN